MTVCLQIFDLSLISQDEIGCFLNLILHTNTIFNHCLVILIAYYFLKGQSISSLIHSIVDFNFKLFIILCIVSDQTQN